MFPNEYLYSRAQGCEKTPWLLGRRPVILGATPGCSLHARLTERGNWASSVGSEAVPVTRATYTPLPGCVYAGSEAIRLRVWRVGEKFAAVTIAAPSECGLVKVGLHHRDAHSKPRMHVSGHLQLVRPRRRDCGAPHQL